MSIRDLDDFFLSKRKKPDDLIASDYGFPGDRDFLTVAERDAINKKLAHLTYRAAQELQKDSLRQNPRTWNYAEMVNRAIGPFLELLDHLESYFFLGDAEQIAMICTARTTIQQTLKNIDNVALLEIEFKA